MSLNWKRKNYFPLLTASEGEESSQALELLVDDMHEDKQRTVNFFLCHAGSEDFLWSLVRFLGSENTRVAGNSAYILGTLAENELGQVRILSLKERHPNAQILPNLTSMLVTDDSESVMNAAGTIGTLAESEQGREWILQEECLSTTVKHITALLSSSNLWTASNAALVLARLTISEEGRSYLLLHDTHESMLLKLVTSLGIDDAGCGMNAAFAIGRLCDIEEGRSKLLQLKETNIMISSLIGMLASQDTGSSKNACFAISCLAASNDGHRSLLNNYNSESMLQTLCNLLSAEDPETGWFAAMTLRTLASQKSGCLRLRDHAVVVPSLQKVQSKLHLSEDTREEVVQALEMLKRLEKPRLPKLEVKGAFEVAASWETVQLKTDLEVVYKLFDGSKCVYQGTESSCLVAGLRADTQYSFRVQVCTEGDSSLYSDVTIATTQECIPDMPRAIHLIGLTATQLKIGWSPPENTNGSLKGYVVYNGTSKVECTNELSTIISGLTPSTTYEIYVCAWNLKGKGPKISLSATTRELGAQAPSKPQVMVKGRSEMQISWDHPEHPQGKLYRFEVMQNGKVVYSGTSTQCSTCKLKADTEYSFTVVAVTSEGKFESETVKKRTMKDEYDDIPSTKSSYFHHLKVSEQEQVKPAVKSKSVSKPLSSPTKDKETKALRTKTSKYHQPVEPSYSPAAASVSTYNFSDLIRAKPPRPHSAASTASSKALSSAHSKSTDTPEEKELNKPTAKISFTHNKISQSNSLGEAEEEKTAVGIMLSHLDLTEKPPSTSDRVVKKHKTRSSNKSAKNKLKALKNKPRATETNQQEWRNKPRVAATETNQQEWRKGSGGVSLDKISSFNREAKAFYEENSITATATAATIATAAAANSVGTSAATNTAGVTSEEFNQDDREAGGRDHFLHRSSRESKTFLAPSKKTDIAKYISLAAKSRNEVDSSRKLPTNNRKQQLHDKDVQAFFLSDMGRNLTTADILGSSPRGYVSFTDWEQGAAVVPQSVAPSKHQYSLGTAACDDFSLYTTSTGSDSWIRDHGKVLLNSSNPAASNPAPGNVASSYQRSVTFVGAQRSMPPISFAPKKGFLPGPSLGPPPESPPRNYSPEFPNSQSSNNQSKFIPTQFRTQPLNLPSPLHRGSTSINFYDKGGPANKPKRSDTTTASVVERAYIKKLEELAKIPPVNTVPNNNEMCDSCTNQRMIPAKTRENEFGMPNYKSKTSLYLHSPKHKLRQQLVVGNSTTI